MLVLWMILHVNNTVIWKIIKGAVGAAIELMTAQRILTVDARNLAELKITDFMSELRVIEALVADVSIKWLIEMRLVTVNI